MPKKATEPLESHHIKLFLGDFAELDRILAGKLSPSIAVRILVRNFIVKTREKVQQKHSSKPLEVDLDDEPEQPGSPIQQEPT